MAFRASKDPHAVNGEEASQLKKSLQDLQVIAESREKNINEVSNFMHAQQIILSFDCLLWWHDARDANQFFIFVLHLSSY